MIPRTTPDNAILDRLSQTVTDCPPMMFRDVVKALKDAGFVTMRLEEFEFESRRAAEYDGFKAAVELLAPARPDLVSVVKSWIRARHAAQANDGKGSAEEVNRLADRVYSAEAEMERLVG